MGNFKPSEDTSLRQRPRPQPRPQPPPMQIPPQPQPIMPPPALREPLRPLPNLNTEPPRLLQPKSLSVRERPTSARSESILFRGPHRDSSFNLKRASTELECITAASQLYQDSMVTFSNTLPRSHSIGAEDPVPRRHAAIHASMDSTRSKQLLSQWKSKNENRKLSLQAGEGPEGGIEVRCSSEPTAMGLEGPPGQYMKMAASVVPLPNHNGGGGGGARVSIQSRPGSSQLVHIPEETQENACSSFQEDTEEVSDGGGGGMVVNARSKWMKMAEKNTPCRTNSQPRIMQVIAMSKQQGMIHGSPKSEGSAVSRTGSIRYKALTEQDSVTGIVHVDAHPENKPNSDAGGSWRWTAPPERISVRQCFELNDLNRNSESCDSQDGCVRDMSNPHHPHFHHHHHFHHPHQHHQAITTIRVTPVESSSEAEGASETLSLASSRDSTLRRKNIILLPERGQSPENAKNLPHFFKSSPTPPPTVTFKE